jgi:hypothetical protein
MGRSDATLSWFLASRWRLRMVWIPMVVVSFLLLTWNSDVRATPPWWVLLLGEGLFIFGIMLPMLSLRRASVGYREKADPAKKNSEKQE